MDLDSRGSLGYIYERRGHRSLLMKRSVGECGDCNGRIKGADWGKEGVLGGRIHGYFGADDRNLDRARTDEPE